MSQIVSVYNLWFQLWNTNYVPLCMDHPKWNIDDENLCEGDLVYFKLTNSKLTADWLLGKVEYVIEGRDDRIRKVGISYKCDTEGDGYRHSVVERPSHSTVKPWNVEDKTLLDDMKNADELATRLLDKERFNDSSEKFDDVEEKGGGAKDDLGDGDHDDGPVHNGLFDFRLDKKFMNEREESARYYIQSMNKFRVNSGNAASWETFSTISASSRIGVKTKHI